MEDQDEAAEERPSTMGDEHLWSGWKRELSGWNAFGLVEDSFVWESSLMDRRKFFEVRKCFWDSRGLQCELEHIFIALLG